ASQGVTDGSVVASGDGDVGTSLVGKTFSLSHQYSANGVFDLDVIVTDDDGGTGSVSTTVGIFVSEEGPPPDLQAPQSVTSTKDNDATFITVDQDVWGGKRLDAKTALFRPQTWNESFADSSFITIAGKKLGAGINTSTKGNMEMYYKGGEIQGDVSVTYPGEITLTFPGVNSFLAGETVPLSGQWTLDNGGATMDAETLGDIKLLFRLKVDSKIIPDIRILDKSSGPNPVGINNVNFDTRNKDTGADTEIFSVKALGEGKDKVPAYVTKSLLLGTDFKVRPISVSPKTTNESVQPDTGTIIIQATNQFAEISLDLDSIATFFLSGLGLPSLGFTTPEVPPPPPSGNIFKYDIFDATNKIKFNAHQKLTFDTDVLIKLEFSKPVSGVTGSFVSTTTTGDGKISSVTYMAGEEIEITFPSDETDPITVTPTAFLDPVKTKIRNFAKIIVNSDVTMTALNVNAKLLSFEVTPTKIKLAIVPHFDNWHCHDRFLGACIDGEYHHRHFHPIGTIPGLEFKGLEFGFGPVWDSGPQGEITEEKIIINKVFSLGGFGVPVTLDSFLLDPEVPPTADADGPYEVDEGSIVLLDGSGSFDIDLPAQPLTHNWDLDDNGSFETNGESVDFIGIDGPAFFPITIEVCDPLNCDTDSSSVVVLNVAPTVSAGDDDTVDEGSLFTRVATFTDPGADTWEGTVDWGDGTPVEPITTISPPVGPALPGDFSVEHIYADNGVYTVTITITDDDAGVGVDTFDVTVSNVVPPVEAGTDQEYVIHDVTSLDPAEYSDAGFDCAVCNTQENFTATVNWGEGSDEPLVVTEVPGSPGVFTLGTASGTHIYRLPGEYTVTVTVTDDDGGSTSDTLVNTILGAQDLKNRAISFLSPFDDEKRVEKAIDAINDSLDSKLWINEAYLDEKQGHKVYSEERKAVKELQQLLKDGEKKGIDPALKEAAKDAIDLLVNSDRVLTITLMLDSSAATADKQNDQNKIDKENTTAEDEFSQGDASRDAGDFDNAIQHYRKAWEHAGLALKAAS
ncbi:MAG: PKD domain-containing protein, partial [Thaumarchaeota archaeon]|nr:PKD domain-containing protein [Nitrososphaerota archaeon]